MTRIGTLLSTLALAIGLGITVQPAEAAPGLTRAQISVYSAASVSSHVLATLKRGTYVVVKSCGARWCQVHRSGLDGWVLRTQLYNPYYGSRLYYQFPPYTPVPGRTNRSDLR